MALQTTANATLAIVLGAPATYDEAGFAALSYVNVGSIETFSEFGASATVTPFTSVDNPNVQKFIGAVDNGQLSLGLGQDLSDAGQALFQNAVDTGNAAYTQQHSVRFTYPDGTIQYFTAKISSYTVNPADANAVVRSTGNLEIDNNLIEVAAP